MRTAASLTAEVKWACSVQCVLQRLSRSKLWNSCCANFNCVAGARIAAGAGRAVADVECAKTNQRHCVAFVKRHFDGIDHGLQRAGCRRFGDVGVFGNVFNQFCFIHSGPFGFGSLGYGLWIRCRRWASSVGLGCQRVGEPGFTKPLAAQRNDWACHGPATFSTSRHTL